MTVARKKLRYPGSCVKCRAATPAGTMAWHDSGARKVTCDACYARASNALVSPTAIAAVVPLPPPKPIEIGTPGVSAQREYVKRRAKLDHQIEDKWGTGRLGRFAKRFVNEPQATSAWAKGASGEQRLGSALERGCSAPTVVLHDRRVPGTGGNIDHLVIGASGIWIVDAKNYTGKVEERDRGGATRSDLRLYVGNRDRTRLVRAMGWQADAVRKQIEPIGLGHLPIHQVLCFTNSEWPRFAKPFALHGVWVVWGSVLAEKINESGPLTPDTINTVAHRLSDRLAASV